ncbi:hypothetical protein KFE98_10505 [bacterium SCSIO 12741]|nr:hypothetical protein KFE98_10505 [bacterium SCSIO 12741]
MITPLTSRLHQTLNQLEKFPHESFDIDVAVSYPLLKKAKQILLEEAGKKEKGDRIVQNEILSNRLEDIVRRILYKLLSVGVTYESDAKLVEECTQYVLEYVVKNYPGHLSWRPINMGVHTSGEVKSLDAKVNLTHLDLPSPWEELHYGIENSLFSWNGERWRISPLGKFFKSLSLSSGTVFLLMLENYLNVPERNTAFNANPWHMSKEFLKAFMAEGKSYLDIGEEMYDLRKFDPNMYYLNRLEQFQLANTVDRTEDMRATPPELDGIQVFTMADDVYETSLTDYGKEIVLRVLDESPSVLRSVLENLITFELSGHEYFNSADKTVVKELQDRAEKNREMVGDQLEPLQDICTNLLERKWDILTLRSIPPTIERILKNMLIEAGEVKKSDSSITLGGITKKMEKLNSDGRPIIPFDTIQYVRQIDRNSLAHGSISPNGGIRESLINLMVNVLIKILDDYEMWKAKSKPV